MNDPIQAIIFDFFGVLYLPWTASDLVAAKASQDYSQVNKDVVDLIYAIDGDYQLGILTNADVDTINHVLQLHQLDQRFTGIITSVETGYAKPEPEIYEISVETLGVPKELAALVDDTPINIESAKMFGMHGVLFQDVHQLESDLKNLGVKFS